MVYFTSDLHIGHKNILKYRSEFKTTTEHDNYMFSKIEELTKRDILYIIGDFIFDNDNFDKYISRLNKVKCRIKFIFGNHDSLKLLKVDKLEIQLPLFSYKSIWISHCPIHSNELRGRKGNIHGHLHKEKLIDQQYFNVNIDVNNYEFVKLDTIKNYFVKLEK